MKLLNGEHKHLPEKRLPESLPVREKLSPTNMLVRGIVSNVLFNRIELLPEKLLEK